jgi:hypothetical protein
MTKFYLIEGSVTERQLDDGEVLKSWECTRQVPRFYISVNQYGIVSENHAVQIALGILCLVPRKDNDPDWNLRATLVEIS